MEPEGLAIGHVVSEVELIEALLLPLEKGLLLVQQGVYQQHPLAPAPQPPLQHLLLVLLLPPQPPYLPQVVPLRLLHPLVEVPQLVEGRPRVSVHHLPLPRPCLNRLNALLGPQQRPLLFRKGLFFLNVL